MKTILPLLILISLFFASCTKEESKDQEKPDVQFVFPQSCDTLLAGKTYNLKAVLSDNKGVASYQVLVHHNFDHHGHSTEIDECVLDEKKQADNPWVLEQNFKSNTGDKEFVMEESLLVPDGIDAGDYHMQITVVDINGWSSFKILSIKIQ
jgi:hypothetical protein